MKAFADMWRDIGLAAMMLSGGESALLAYAAIRATGTSIWRLQEQMALIYLDHPECRATVRSMGTIGCKHVFRLCAATGLFACVFCHRHENLMADAVPCPQHTLSG